MTAPKRELAKGLKGGNPQMKNAVAAFVLLHEAHAMLRAIAQADYDRMARVHALVKQEYDALLASQRKEWET